MHAIARAERALHAGAVDEIDCADHAKEGPEVVPAPPLAHEDYHEWHEYADRYDFLNDLELRNVEPRGRANPVRWHRYNVLDKGDKPANQDNRYERPLRLARLVELEMPVPGKSHEKIAHREHPDRDHDGDRARQPCAPFTTASPST